MALIADQGYAAITVDQIAAAADVSPSTFFRYFPTKEDAVLTDDYDAPMIELFRGLPADLKPLDAFRVAFRQIFDGMGAEEREQEATRMRVIIAVPELRDRMLGTMTDTILMLSGLIAERSSRANDDPAVQYLAGAVVGVAMTALVRAAANPAADPLAMVEEALDALAGGLPL